MTWACPANEAITYSRSALDGRRLRKPDAGRRASRRGHAPRHLSPASAPYACGEMFLLVTGASGAGKSTARQLVADELAAHVDCIELGHLVSFPPTPTLAWRQQATEAAVQRALTLQAVGRHLLLAGDPIAAGEVIAAPSAAMLDAIAVCLLDVSPRVQAARLARRCIAPGGRSR